MFSIPLDIEKSIVVDRPVQTVFDTVADFKTWPSWSPWLCQEPTCPIEITGEAGTVGSRQSWNGEFIGSGMIEITGTDAPGRVDFDIHFFKPWKSESKVGFRLEETDGGNGTTLSWWMKGTLPLFFFFTKGMMTAAIGSDYGRGLSMLKEYVETGQVLSRIALKGIEPRERVHYVGRRRTASMNEMPKLMGEDFASLSDLLAQKTLPKPEQVATIYHKFDITRGIADYTAAYFYLFEPSRVDGMTLGTIPTHKALRVDHKGAYRHLGNAWSAAMGCSRAKHKINKSLPMYEVYSSDPDDTAEADIATEIYLPVRA